MSALTGDGIEELRSDLISLLPEGPMYYPADTDTDMPLEARIAELVREQALHLTKEEVPHAITAEVVEIDDKHVHVRLYTETESQKQILIGKGGHDGARDRPQARGPFVEQLARPPDVSAAAGEGVAEVAPQPDDARAARALTAPPRTGIHARAMLALSGGHLAADFASGSVPALIPFLTDRFDLSYALAAMLLLAATVSSSLVQPLFGLWSDRRGALWLIPGGVAARGGRRRRRRGLAGLPARRAARVRRRARGRGVPSRGREVRRLRERAQARERDVVLQHRRQPRLRARRVRRPASSSSGSGSAAGSLAMIPVARRRRSSCCASCRTSRALTPGAAAESHRRGDDRRRAMALLGAVIALRSVAWFALLAFVPLWVGRSRPLEGGRQPAALPDAARGRDRDARCSARSPTAIGLRRTLVVTQAPIAPLILVFVYVGGVAGVVALMLVGVCVVGTFGVTMVLSQLYLPRHVGMASGLSIGLAMGIGGVAAVILGAVADAVDLQVALTIAAVAPALGVLLCLRLPAPSQRALLAV